MDDHYIWLARDTQDYIHYELKGVIADMEGMEELYRRNGHLPFLNGWLRNLADLKRMYVRSEQLRNMCTCHLHLEEGLCEACRRNEPELPFCETCFRSLQSE